MNDNTALVTTLALIILAGFIFSGKPDITDGIIYQLTEELPVHSPSKLNETLLDLRDNLPDDNSTSTTSTKRLIDNIIKDY